MNAVGKRNHNEAATKRITKSSQRELNRKLFARWPFAECCLQFSYKHFIGPRNATRPPILLAPSPTRITSARTHTHRPTDGSECISNRCTSENVFHFVSRYSLLVVVVVKRPFCFSFIFPLYCCYYYYHRVFFEMANEPIIYTVRVVALMIDNKFVVLFGCANSNGRIVFALIHSYGRWNMVDARSNCARQRADFV